MQIALDQVTYTPAIFDRPESVLCTREGDVLASHRAAGVIRVSQDGRCTILGKPDPEVAKAGFLPNGVALHPDGTIYVANMDGAGGVWRIGSDGILRPHVLEVDGVALTAANFVLVDSRHRLWITSSTRCPDRSDPFNKNIHDGYIVLYDTRGARIVADGLAFTNECRLNRDETALYVCETAGARVSRFAIDQHGALRTREFWAEFDSGTYPDGCTFDSSEHLWVASPVGNRVWRVAPSGAGQLVLEDALPGRVEETEKARSAGMFGRQHFYNQKGRYLESITSIAFGGADLRTIYLGSLTSNRLARLRVRQDEDFTTA
jgi:sugar lactone lactonase YvrE